MSSETPAEEGGVEYEPSFRPTGGGGQSLDTPGNPPGERAPVAGPGTPESLASGASGPEDLPSPE